MKISLDGSRVVPCGQTDMTKTVFAFSNSTNEPKIPQSTDSNYEDSVLLLLNVGCHFLVNMA